MSCVKLPHTLIVAHSSSGPFLAYLPGHRNKCENVKVVLYALIKASHFYCTFNNSWVFHDILQVVWVHFVKGVISWSKQSVLARLTQLVHHIGS